VRILVTDGDERTALAATRSLGRTAEVHVASRGRRCLAGRSRRATATHVVPSPLADPEGFRARIGALAQALLLDAILPVSDAACSALLPERDRLGPAVLLAPDERAYTLLSDKASVEALARRHGLQVPSGGEAADAAAAVALAQTLGWPVMLKPVRSVSATTGRVRKVSPTPVADAQALRAAWNDLVGEGRALVQQIVPGWGEGVFVLRGGGRTLAAFAHRRLREKPPEGGVSVLRESIPLPEDRLRRVEAILDEAGFSGVAMAEFKCDGEHAWLMEFNARLWGSLQLAIDAGVDFPRLMVEAGLGGSPAPSVDYRLGVGSRWLLGDVDHAIALARGAKAPSGATGLAAAARALFGRSPGATRFEVLRRDDPAPFLHELRAWLGALARPG
jgi:predicted ATP-grasp superfamily ATP-dependent carboligase